MKSNNRVERSTMHAHVHKVVKGLVCVSNECCGHLCYLPYVGKYSPAVCCRNSWHQRVISWLWFWRMGEWCLPLKRPERFISQTQALFFGWEPPFLSCTDSARPVAHNPVITSSRLSFHNKESFFFSSSITSLAFTFSTFVVHPPLSPNLQDPSLLSDYLHSI